MAITFEPILLDGSLGDDDGCLILRDGRLVAVVSRLGTMHDELAGRWFVEWVFGDIFDIGGRIFPDLPSIAAALGEAASE